MSEHLEIATISFTGSIVTEKKKASRKKRVRGWY